MVRQRGQRGIKLIACALAGLGLFVSGAAPLPAQSGRIVARDGWEAFIPATYRGGDATQPKERYGVLVLTDSSLAMYKCRSVSCYDEPPKLPWDGPAYFTIPFLRVTNVSSSISPRAASGGEILLFNGITGGEKEGLVGVTYETGSSVEVPTFKVGPAVAEALEAKLRYRLKKLGITLSERP